MLKVGDTVKVISKTTCGSYNGDSEELIAIGSICTVEEVLVISNYARSSYKVKPIDTPYSFLYYEDELEKGKLEWIPENKEKNKTITYTIKEIEKRRELIKKREFAIGENAAEIMLIYHDLELDEEVSPINSPNIDSIELLHNISKLAVQFEDEYPDANDYFDDISDFATKELKELYGFYKPITFVKFYNVRRNTRLEIPMQYKSFSGLLNTDQRLAAYDKLREIVSDDFADERVIESAVME